MLHVSLIVHTYTTLDPDPEDGWDWGQHDGYVDRVVVVDDEYGRGYTGADTDLDRPFFVVYAEYYTGNTFGSSMEASVVGVVKTYEEASALRDEAEQFKGFGELSNGYYIPWTGYFESLKKIGIEEIR